MKYWIKLWVEILNDPKMGTLDDRLWRRAIECFLMAGQVDKGGLLPPLAAMAWSTRQAEADLLADLVILAAAGLVHEDDAGLWWVSNFSKRQAPSSSTERSRRHRARQIEAQYYSSDVPNVAEDATQMQRSCNGDETIGPAEEKRREEKEEEKEKRRERAPSGAAEDLTATWVAARYELQGVNAALYSNWLGGSSLVSYEDDRAMIQVRDQYAVEWCRSRLKLPIQRALSGALDREAGDLVGVEFQTAEGP